MHWNLALWIFDLPAAKGQGIKMQARCSALIALFVALPFLNSCVSYSLPGIPAAQGAADPQLQALVRRAIRKQDQYAQLELGTRYEYGRGVPVNWKLAGQLYLQAATGTPGGLWNMGAGGKLSYEVGPHRKGLPEAKARLQALKAKMRAAGIRCTGIGWSAVTC